MENKNFVTKDQKPDELIAEFMGYTVHDFISFKTAFKNEKHYFFDTSLRYRDSWDDLMPVVEKIMQLPNNRYPNGVFENLVDVSITGCSAEITDAYNGDDFHVLAMEGSLIENVYYAVVEFIKWFNKQK